MKNNRDLSILPFYDDLFITIAADNSGSVGQKREDEVNVPYDAVSYFGARVCAMETLAAGAEPKTLIIHSFNDEKAWDPLTGGAKRAFRELGWNDIEVTGSTESNFSLSQSASCFTLIGSVLESGLRINVTPQDASYAVIGKPLVGEEVISQAEDVLPLALFQKLCRFEGVHELVPVGSKGIRKKLGLICEEADHYSSDFPMDKSAGPSSCIVISYDPSVEKELRQLTGRYFYGLYKKC
jgi:hypothetical protein